MVGFDGVGATLQASLTGCLISGRPMPKGCQMAPYMPVLMKAGEMISTLGISARYQGRIRISSTWEACFRHCAGIWFLCRRIKA